MKQQEAEIPTVKDAADVDTTIGGSSNGTGEDTAGNQAQSGEAQTREGVAESETPSGRSSNSHQNSPSTDAPLRSAETKTESVADDIAAKDTMATGYQPRDGNEEGTPSVRSMHRADEPTERISSQTAELSRDPSIPAGKEDTAHPPSTAAAEVAGVHHGSGSQTPPSEHKGEEGIGQPNNSETTVAEGGSTLVAQETPNEETQKASMAASVTAPALPKEGEKEEASVEEATPKPQQATMPPKKAEASRTPLASSQRWAVIDAVTAVDNDETVRAASWQDTSQLMRRVYRSMEAQIQALKSCQTTMTQTVKVRSHCTA